MRRTAVLIAAAAALVLAGLPAAADAAATTLTQVGLSATVSGPSVSVSTTVRARTSVVAQQYGVCVRDRAGRNADFAPKATDTAITTTGTAYRATSVFPAGSFVYFPCVRVAGSWTAVGAPKVFTVTGPTAPSPSPTATPTPAPSPSPSPTATPTPAPSPTSSGPAVLFSDDFSGTGDYDHATWGEWSACTYNGSAAYGSIGCGDRARLDGEGHLAIPASPGQGTSISTKDHFAFTYGTMTARMKVPTEGGYWPAFWALNNNPNGVDASTIGEVDAHESYTSLADYYHVAVHNYSTRSWSGAMDPACGRDHVFGEWHDYSAKVEPGRVSFFLDGVRCGTYVEKGEGGGKPYAFGPDVTRGLWPILTLAVGGAGGQQKPATADARLLVDSVTVTAL